MINWILVVVLVAPGFLAQTLFHETSHAVAALRQGLAITSFKFWPHWVDGERFFFGRVTYRHPGLDVRTDNQRAMLSGAPLISGTVVLCCLATLDVLLGQALGPTLNTILLVYSTCVGVDMIRGFLQAVWRSDRGDANKAARYLGLGQKTKVALGLVLGLASLGLVGLIVVPDLYRSLAPMLRGLLGL